MNPQSTRRVFLRSASAATTAAMASAVLSSQRPLKSHAAQEKQAPAPAKESYDTHAKGIRILPGKWRPHYPWEHIAWVSPSWPSQDYLWLDFPEAIFTSQGLLFLSHINPPFPTVFQNLPKVPWHQTPEGIRFERELPNGISFGGSVMKGGSSKVDLELHIKNGSTEPLGNITLQTCAFLRGIKEFADYTRANKYIHVPPSGWISMEEAQSLEKGNEKYRFGWRTSGKPIADLPVAVTLSNEAERLVAMTWFEDTLSLVSNPSHPCVHADPRFKDLAPGEEASVRGRLIFFEGPLEEFDFEKESPPSL